MRTDRKPFLEKLNQAFASGDTSFLLDHVTDDIEWRIVGTDMISGKDAYELALKQMASPDPLELEINSIISDESNASVSGVMYIREGHYVEFCDVMKFKSADSNLITRITSYAIEIKPND
jgi:hypothetical protein